MALHPAPAPSPHAPGRRSRSRSGRSFARSDGSERQSRGCSAFGLSLKFRGDLTARGAAAGKNTAVFAGVCCAQPGVEEVWGLDGRLLRASAMRRRCELRKGRGAAGGSDPRPWCGVPGASPERGCHGSPRRVRPGRGRQGWRALSWPLGRGKQGLPRTGPGSRGLPRLQKPGGAGCPRAPPARLRCCFLAPTACSKSCVFCGRVSRFSLRPSGVGFSPCLPRGRAAALTF